MSLVQSVSVVSLWTLASRVTGLARQLLMAAWFGAGPMTDAFNVAFRIPNMFRRLFAEGAFSQAFVPVLSSYKTTSSEQETRALIDHIATLLTWVLVVVCCLGVLGAPVLVWSMASGLNPNAQNMAIFMTRWMFPYIGLMSLVAFSAGILNTWRKVAVPAATPVLLNVCMIVGAITLAPVFVNYKMPPIYGLMVGVMVGGMAQLLLQIPALLRVGLLPRLGWRFSALRVAWQHMGVRRIASLMLPALLGVSVAQISLLINTQIASHLPAGSVSWLSYADLLMEFPTAMLGVALGSVLLPRLASAQAAKQHERYSQLLDWGLRLVLALALPCAVILLVFSTPLVSVLYHYGAFKGLDVIQTSSALMGYGVGLLALVSLKVITPGFYAKQDIKTPVKIAILVLILTQLMNLFFVPWIGHAGLTLSIGLGSVCNAGLLLISLIRQKTYHPQSGWLSFGLAVMAASGLMGLFLWFFGMQFDWVQLRITPIWRIGLFLVGAITAMLIYFGLMAIQGYKPQVLMGKGLD